MKAVMINACVLVAITFSSVAVAAPNLINDSDVNIQPLSPEFRLFGSKSEGRIVSHEEDLTWNKCAKLELLHCSVDANGITNVCLGIQIGGDAEHEGFPVRGGTKYNFSFEMKGTAPNVIVVQRTWDSYGHVSQKATEMFCVTPQKQWTSYKGVLEAPKDAVRAALVLQFWGNMPRYVDVCTPPYYILADKFKVEEVRLGREIWPVSAIVIPEDGVVEWRDFRSLELVDAPARLPTVMKARMTDNALKFKFSFDGAKPLPNSSGTDVWTHDLVELIFVKHGKPSEVLHLGLNAVGAKWMNGDAPDCSQWEGLSKIREDGWDAVVSVPWKVLGFESRPKKGTQIRFNAMREHTVEQSEKVDVRKGNRCGRGWLLDDSVFSFAGEEFGNQKRFGVIIIGDDPKYGVDASSWWQGEECRKENERIARLKRQRMIVAQVPLHTDPEIPYLPPEVFEPQPVFRVRAAINERTALPVAVANMTDELEEFRVTLTYDANPPSQAYEHSMPRMGLRSTEGCLLGERHITMRRGVGFRDSDDPHHGKRYDILEKMGEASAVPVAAHEAGLVWIQFDCHGVTPGLYRGELIVTPLAGGCGEKVEIMSRKDGTKTLRVSGDTKVIPVELEVLPFALREPTDFALQPFRSAWSEYQLEFMNEYDCVEFMVQPWFFDMSFNPDGSVRTASTRASLIPHLQILKRHVKKIGECPRIMIGYDCYRVFKEFHAGKSGLAFDTPAYWAAWRNWLQHVDDTMMKNGFRHDDFVMEVFDEPNLKDFTLAEVERVYREARSSVPAVRLLNTNGERMFFKAVSPYVDQWYFSQNVFGDSKIMEYPKALLSEGKSVSMYACDTSLRQSLYRYYRILAWKAASIGAKYVSIYQFFDQQPGASFRKEPDGGLAYDTSQACIPSIRLENLYAGMTDIRYLKLLESTARASNSNLAQEALAFVAQSLHDVPRKYPHDDTAAGNFREKCVSYLSKLNTNQGGKK